MVQQAQVFKSINNDSVKTIALLIQKASLYNSKISISVDGRRANAKSLLGMMSLGLEVGQELSIECDGNDEEQAMQELVSFLEGA